MTTLSYAGQDMLVSELIQLAEELEKTAAEKKKLSDTANEVKLSNSYAQQASDRLKEAAAVRRFVRRNTDLHAILGKYGLESGQYFLSCTRDEDGRIVSVHSIGMYEEQAEHFKKLLPGYTVTPVAGEERKYGRWVHLDIEPVVKLLKTVLQLHTKNNAAARSLSLFFRNPVELKRVKVAENAGRLFHVQDCRGLWQGRCGDFTISEWLVEEQVPEGRWFQVPDGGQKRLDLTKLDPIQLQTYKELAGLFMAGL